MSAQEPKLLAETVPTPVAPKRSTRFPFPFLSPSALTLRAELQSVKMHQLILMRFNSSARDAKPDQARPGQARPANVLLVPPKLAPATSLVSTIFGHCPGPRTEPHGTARRCILMMPASARLSLPPCVSLPYTLALPLGTLGVRVCWSCHGSAIVKFNQGNLCASIAYRDKLT